jgi:hypothetical protein
LRYVRRESGRFNTQTVGTRTGFAFPERHSYQSDRITVLLLASGRPANHKDIFAMGYKAKKTDHAGAKHGNGAYWGPKRGAKKESNKIRRRAARELLIAEQRHEPDIEPRQRD